MNPTFHYEDNLNQVISLTPNFSKYKKNFPEKTEKNACFNYFSCCNFKSKKILKNENNDNMKINIHNPDSDFTNKISDLRRKTKKNLKNDFENNLFLSPKKETLKFKEILTESIMNSSFLEFLNIYNKKMFLLNYEEKSIYVLIYLNCIDLSKNPISSDIERSNSDVKSISRTQYSFLNNFTSSEIEIDDFFKIGEIINDRFDNINLILNPFTNKDDFPLMLNNRQNTFVCALNENLLDINSMKKNVNYGFFKDRIFFINEKFLEMKIIQKIDLIFLHINSNEFENIRPIMAKALNFTENIIVCLTDIKFIIRFADVCKYYYEKLYEKKFITIKNLSVDVEIFQNKKKIKCILLCFGKPNKVNKITEYIFLKQFFANYNKAFNKEIERFVEYLNQKLKGNELRYLILQCFLNINKNENLFQKLISILLINNKIHNDELLNFFTDQNVYKFNLNDFAEKENFNNSNLSNSSSDKTFGFSEYPMSNSDNDVCSKIKNQISKTN